MAERTVWKYVLDGTVNTVRMPIEAKILTVAAQGYDLCVWALVVPANATETRVVEVYGTGLPIPHGLALEYLGSAHFANPEPLVFHIFERHGSAFEQAARRSLEELQRVIDPRATT